MADDAVGDHKVIDIHPHVISEDIARYPLSPLFGAQSDWSRERPMPITQLTASMDEAGVSKAAIAQVSTCYGYDNSYLLDSVSSSRDRFVAVCSFDLLDPAATSRILNATPRGLAGVRIFTGGVRPFDTSTLDDRRSFPVWEMCGQLNLPISIQTGPMGLAQVAGLAKRFPMVKIVLDHLARPDISDGPPYSKAVSLFAMGSFDNIYLKATPRTFQESMEGLATAQTFFPRLLAEFGSSRIAWGSNFPASPGRLSHLLATARQRIDFLSPDDRSWIFHKTAESLYPALAEERTTPETPLSEPGSLRGSFR